MNQIPAYEVRVSQDGYMLFCTPCQLHDGELLTVEEAVELLLKREVVIVKATDNNELLKAWKKAQGLE